MPNSNRKGLDKVRIFSLSVANGGLSEKTEKESGLILRSTIQYEYMKDRQNNESFGYSSAIH